MKSGCHKILLVAFAISCAVAIASFAEKEKPDNKAIDDYNFAVWLYNTGKYPVAAESYRNFLQNYPGHERAADSRFGLAQALFHTDKFQEAAGEYEKVRAEKKDFSQGAELCFQLGQTYAALNRFADAASLFEETSSKYPSHYLADWATARRAACLISIGKNKEAEALLKTFMDDYSAGSTAIEKMPATKAMFQKMDTAGIKAGDAFLSLVERSAFYYALAQFNQNSFADAQKSFEHFLSRYSDSTLKDETSFRLAQSYYRQELFAKAADRYESLAAGAGEFAASAGFERGLALYKAGKLKDAASAFAQMAGRFPKNQQAPKARLYSGTFLFEAGDYKGAIERLETMTKEKSEAADEAAYWIGMSLVKLGDNVKAEQAFADVVAVYPESPLSGDMLLGLADARLAQNKFGPAAEAFQKYARDFEKSEQAPRALYSACTALHRSDKYTESDDLCGIFLGKYGKNELAPQAMFLSGENRFLLKRYDNAAVRYTEFLLKGDKTPDRMARAHYRMAWVHRYGKRNEDALAELRKIDAVAAGETIAGEMKYLEGACLFETGEFTNAVKALSGYIDARDHSRFGDDALLKLAVSQMKQNRKDRAAADLERFMKEYPKSELLSQVRYQLAECYYDQKSYSKAIESYTLVAGRDKDDDLTPYAMLGIGLCLYDQEKWEEAAKAFGEMAGKFPKAESTAQALYRKSRSLIKLKKWELAEQASRSLLTAFPKHELARTSLIAAGTCLQEMQKWAEAAVAFKSVSDDYTAGDDQARILYEEAWSWRQAGKDDESLKAFRHLADKYSVDPLAADAYFYLAEAMYKGKQDAKETPKQRDQRLTEACTLYEKVLPVVKDKRLVDKAVYRIGWCNWLTEQYPKAAAAFDRLIKEFPDTELLADSVFQAGQSYAKAGQPAAAAERFRTLTGDSKFASFEFLPDAYMGLANCLIILDKHSETIEPLEALIRKNKDDRVLAQANFLLGKAKFSMKKYDDAIECFQEVAKRTKTETGAEAQFYIGQSIQAKNDMKAAIVAYLRVEALYHEHSEWVAAAKFESAKCSDALGDTAQAKAIYGDIVKDYGNTKWAKPAAERLGTK
ncbi:MAG: tetratricopeptide repeat protein [bacterium]